MLSSYIVQVQMTFSDFVEKFRHKEEKDTNAGQDDEQCYYLQQALVTGQGQHILGDFKTVNWNLVYKW